MTTDLELDRILGEWLGAGAERAPADAVADAIVAAGRVGQRRSTSRSRVRTLFIRPIGRARLVGAILAVAVAATSLLLPTGASRVGALSVAARDFPWVVPWTTSAGQVAFVARLSGDAPAGVYWRAMAYDTVRPDGWTVGDGPAVGVPAGAPLPSGPDEAAAGTWGTWGTPVHATIDPAGYQEHLVLAPGVALRVGADATARLFADGGGLAGVQLAGPGPYAVDGVTLTPDDTTHAAALRAAGDAYPSTIGPSFTDVPSGLLGPAARGLLDAALATTPDRDPYDVAVAIEAYLKTPRRFTYSTDLTGLGCGALSAVECFARTRTGYCLQFSTTMAVLVRAALPGHPIPTRIVQGFLPGERVGTTETVSIARVHAWVEVYFPGYGWIPFDPTPGIGSGSIVASPVRTPPSVSSAP